MIGNNMLENVISILETEERVYNHGKKTLFLNILMNKYQDNFDKPIPLLELIRILFDENAYLRDWLAKIITFSVFGGNDIIHRKQIHIAEKDFQSYSDLIKLIPNDLLSGKKFVLNVDPKALPGLLVLNSMSNSYTRVYNDHYKEEAAKLTNELVKILYDEFSQQSEVCSQGLEDFVLTACETIKSTNGRSISLGKILSHLEKFPWEEHPLRELVVKSKDCSESLNLAGVWGELYKKIAPTTIIYSYKAEGLYDRPLHFTAVSVNDCNYYKFMSLAGLPQTPHGGYGAVAYRTSIKYYDNNPLTTVFAVFASEEPYNGDDDFEKMRIKMYVTATTSKNAVFGSHMGIEKVQHRDHEVELKGLSEHLHKFAACVITHWNPDAKYMITTPMPVMLTLFHKFLKNHGKLEAMTVDMDMARLMRERYAEFTSAENKRTDGWEEGYKGIPNCSKSDYINTTILADHVRFQEDKEMRFPITGYEQSNSSGEARITLPDGRVVTITPEEKSGPYNWFFGHCYQGGESSPGVTVVDYDVLASLGGTRYLIEETVVLGAQTVVSDAQTE
jgi:hypothetical protein